MPDQTPSIGRIVHYREPADGSGTIVGGDFHFAAIITMTPEEWTPGYKDSSGEWHATENSPQPKANCVHLYLFPPPITSGGEKWADDRLICQDVPYGTGPGTWSWPPIV